MDIPVDIKDKTSVKRYIENNYTVTLSKEEKKYARTQKKKFKEEVHQISNYEFDSF
jgi:hypothetical protein